MSAYFRLEQSVNAEWPRDITESGILMCVSEEQCLKAAFPIVVRALPRVRLVKAVQPENASSSIEVTELPICTLAKLVQSRNA